MATLKDIVNNEKYKALDEKTRLEVFDKLSVSDTGFGSLDDSTKSEVRAKITGVSTKSTSATKEIKEPFPYLNFLPGGKDLNRGIMESMQSMEKDRPGYLERNRRNELIKEIGGSVATGIGAEAALATAGPKIMQGAKFVPRVLRAATSSAAAAQPLSYDSLKDRMMATAGAAVAGPMIGEGVNVAGKAIVGSKNAFLAFKDAVKSIPKTLTSEGKVQVATNLRTAFQEVPKIARNNFADDLIRLNSQTIASGKNPNINLRNVVDDISSQLKDDELASSINSAINRSPKLRALLKNPDLSERLNLKESQDLLNEIKSVLSETKLGGVGNKATDIPLYEDVINEITKSQLDVYPQFAKTKEVYGKIMNDYKLIRNKIKPGSLIKNIQSKFGDDEIFDAAKRLLSDNKSAIKEMNSFRRAGKIVSGAKKAAIGAGITGAGVKVLNS